MKVWALLFGILGMGPVHGKSIDFDSLGMFRSTYYYLTYEDDFVNGTRDQAVKNKAGESLAWVTSAYKKSLDLEGSGKLRDGRVLNFHERIDGDIRYRVTKNEWGNGVKSCNLVPFRTLAVDPTKIPMGSLVYLPISKGMKLPDGSIHDGFWRAEDIGGAIQKDRVDIFIGRRAWAPLLEQAGIIHLKPFEVLLIELPKPDSCAFKELGSDDANSNSSRTF